MRNVAGVGALVLATAAVVLLVVSLQDGTPSAEARIDLSDLAVAEQKPVFAADPSPLRFAVAAVLSPRRTLENYETLAVYLSEHLARPVEIVQSKSYAETNALVRSGDVAIALVCSGAYVVGRSDFNMEALVVPVVGGEITYQSYLIVPSASTSKEWEDLRDQTFAFTDPLSNSGRLAPLYVLFQMGERPESFFEHFIFTYSHDKSIEAVATGLVDGAAVDSLVYDYMVEHDPLIASRTRVIWRSPQYGINPIVVHPDIDPTLREDLRAVLLAMSETSQGRAVLEHLGVDAFAIPDLDLYNGIERMIEATATR